MDAEALAAGIIERAKRDREEREDTQRRGEEAQRLNDEFHKRRRTVYVALVERKLDAVDDAVQSLLDIGRSLNPRGADYWACEHLDQASRGRPWPHRHFALLIARTAFFDQDPSTLKSLLLTAINAPDLRGAGEFLVVDLLEFYWARCQYPDALPNGQPNLEAAPFTTVFSSVGEFVEALDGLPGFSRETINRRLKSGELITTPPWTKNSTEPHRFKFRDPATQRAVLDRLRSNRTLGTMSHTNAGCALEVTADEADKNMADS